MSSDYFTRRYPRAVSAIPTMTLTVTYPIKPHVFPVWSILRLSLAKVEKVVNPPQSPVVRSKHHELSVVENLAKSPYSSPMKKQPMRLTVKVPQGKEPLPIPFMTVDIM